MHIIGSFGAAESLVRFFGDEDWSLLARCLEIESDSEDCGEFVKEAFFAFLKEKERAHLVSRLKELGEQ